MPTVEANHEFWSVTFDWQAEGEEWSEAWGTSEAQWFSTLYPRIHAYMPPAPVEDFRILEIATGYGRWTDYLRRHCGHLVGIDLSETCIDHCRRRFQNDPRLEFHVTDGRSLSMVEDNSIDFVFSFDSLVHADDDVLELYLAQLRRKLTPNGVGIIHHSNLGEFPAPAIHRTISQRLKRKLFGIQPPATPNYNPTWRSPTMTATKFAQYARAAGLRTISQEKANWAHDTLPIDCISVFTPPGSRFDQELQVVVNTNLMLEAKLIANRAHIYRNPETAEQNAERERRGHYLSSLLGEPI
jgi:ubiquinone/menaquinone biosynthesis C-methylase UbiE